MSQLAQGALRHFVNRELTGKVPTDTDELDQCLDLGNFVGIEHGIWTNFLCLTWSQQMPDTARHRLNFGTQDIGNMRALSRQRAAPGAVHRKRKLGAQTSRRIVNCFEKCADRNALPASKIFA